MGTASHPVGYASGAACAVRVSASSVLVDAVSLPDEAAVDDALLLDGSTTDGSPSFAFISLVDALLNAEAFEARSPSQIGRAHV